MDSTIEKKGVAWAAQEQRAKLMDSTIEKKGVAWAAQEQRAKLPDDILGGDAAMRKAGTGHLPKWSAESQKDYQARLNNTFLGDTYKRTLNYLCGQVFSKPVAFPDGATESFDVFQDDVDRRGNNLTVFANSVFRAGLHHGVSFILTDYSKVITRDGSAGLEYLDEKTDTWRPRTLAAAAENKWGPFFVLVEATQVIDAWADFVDGRFVLTHFRYLETVSESSGPWSRTSINQIRVLSPGAWEIWREQKGKDGKVEWVKHDEGRVSIPEIPISVFMPGEKVTDLTAVPALQGLVDLSLKYWRASSGHGNLMSWMRHPLLFGKCLDTDGSKIEIGPGRMQHSDSPDADLKAVSVVTKDSVDSSRLDLQDIETSMGLYGLRIMTPKSGEITATQVKREGDESDSALKGWAELFQDALAQAMKYAAMWDGEKDGPAPVVNTEFNVILDTVSANVLIAAAKDGIIPRSVVFEELRRRGVFRSDVDWQEARAMMEDESRMAMNQAPAGAQGVASALLGQRQESGQGPA